MGVTNLWQIISPVQQHCPLSSLHGQTLAVDLSIWVVEGQGVRQMQGVVTKPHLRNLFFRISHLLQIGVHPLFVIEGNAPELKQEVMARRQQVRYQNHRQGPRGGRANSRRNFNSCLRECCELLDLLGVPYVQSQGEAEAMCAALNAAGMVDGCITNDGDAFLYGARKVYRNFTLNSKDPHVECYSMDDIEEKLSLDRSKLVAMALLLGCDYLPKGVPGVGMDKAMKLMKVYSDSGVNALHRFAGWKRMDEGALLNQIEVVVYRKARSVADFPQSKVISEFLEVKDKCPKKIQSWKRPQLISLQDYALRKLEWPEEYTEEKILPLLTLWDLLDIKRGNALVQHLVPHRLVKKRQRQGKAYFEIQWYKHYAGTKPQQKPVDGDTEQFYTTLEEQGLLTSCFPEMVHAFEMDENEKNEKKKKPAGKRKQKKRMDKENQNLENVDPVGSVTNKLTELNIKDKSESCGLKTVCESQSTERERMISQSEEYDSIDLTACDTDKDLVYITETSGTTSCLLTSDIEYKCTGENYYHDDIDDDDILMSVLGPSNVGTESAESLNATKECAGKVGNDYRYTEVAEVDSESDQEYIPLSQRLQQRMKTNSSNSEKNIVHKSTVQSTNIMRSSSLSSKSNGKSVSNIEGICMKKEVPTTEYSEVKKRKAKMDQKSTSYKENVANTDASSHQRHCDNNAGVLKLSQTSAFSPTKYETEKISANVRRPFQHVQERTLSSSPNSVVFSPFSGMDATKVTDFTHIARMNFTSVSTPKLEGLSQSDQSNRSGFGKLPDIELNLTGHLPSSCQKEYIGSSKDRTKSLSAHDLKCSNLKESAYIDSHRQRHLPSANRLNISPFTPASVDKSLLSSRLKKSVNQSMNSTRSVGSSFALEYGNFNISASLLQNFSQHSVLLSLMADENSVYGSPFVPSECSVNMNSSTGASPFFSNISTKSSLGVSSTVDDFSSLSQPNVGHPHASPKFGSSDVCKLSFCSDSASRSATQKTVTQSQIHELSSLVQDLSFSETAVPKEGPIQSDTSTLSLTNSQHEDESVRASVISLARKIVDGSTSSGSKLEVTVNDSKCEESHHADRMCDNEESPVNLLDRLKSRLNTGLLQDFVKQRKVSVKPIRD